jgi:RNAse (barnase) inhibitor barstar
MREILLDSSDWRTRDDFYAALLPALGAPEWHGRNLDALNDTIHAGDINEINPPFAIRIVGCDALSQDLRAYVYRFLELIADLRKEGIPVEATCSEAPYF